MKNRLKSISKSFDKQVLVNFNNTVGTLKGPVDLLSFKFEISSSISFWVTGNKQN